MITDFLNTVDPIYKLKIYSDDEYNMINVYCNINENIKFIIDGLIKKYSHKYIIEFMIPEIIGTDNKPYYPGKVKYDQEVEFFTIRYKTI